MLTIGKAHSEGLVEYIEAVGKLRGESEWISERKDSVISLVLNIQQVDITSAASGVLGMKLLETGIEIPVRKNCGSTVLQSLEYARRLWAMMEYLGKI